METLLQWASSHFCPTRRGSKQQCHCSRSPPCCRREAYLGRAIIRPQALRRGAVQRRAFLAARAAVVRLQAAARGMLVRRRVAAMHAAAVVVQACFRGCRARTAIRQQQVSPARGAICCAYPCHTPCSRTKCYIAALRLQVPLESSSSIAEPHMRQLVLPF